jgi:hypothetical protein
VYDNEGNRYRQLVKSGNDDLRQDAVMQQFFGLVNSLLAQNTAARSRRLGIITYKVVGAWRACQWPSPMARISKPSPMTHVGNPS